MKGRGARKVLIGVILVVLANLFGVMLLQGGHLYDTQTAFDDLMMTNSHQQPDSRIAIVAIDDKTLKTFGPLGSWDRSHYADLIRNLKAAGARVVAFDIAFIDPTKADPVVAQAIQYAQSDQGGKPMPVFLAVVGDQLLSHVPGKGLSYDAFLHVTPGIMAGQPQLANVTVDPDGSEVRHLPLLAVSPQERYFLLPFSAANAYLGRPPLQQSAKLGPSQIQFGNETIPTDSAYRMLVDFVGPPKSFTKISLSDAANGNVNPAVFKNKLIFVGAYQASTIADNYPVPTSGNGKMDGVEIWANGAQNILDGKFPVIEGNGSTIAFMVVFSGLAATAFFFLGAAGWLAALCLIALYSLGAFFLTTLRLSASGGGVVQLPNLIYVDSTILLGSAALFVYFFLYEQRSKKAISQMFGKYVTPEVAQHLVSMQERGELSLGGTLKTGTIMFGDIRGFTTLSEGMEPEEVMAMLNRYFDKMVEIIIKHGGTISKFIGDNVMVLFNLPIETPGNHALAAARAGDEIQRWIKQYREEHPEEVAAFGFGINSGELVAGNMGSQDRMEYTVIGEVVNVANSLCGTAERDEVAISEETYKLIKDSGAVIVDRGQVPVKGKTEEIHIYSVVGFQGQSDAKNEAAVIASASGA